jgi:hypothetical protein
VAWRDRDGDGAEVQQTVTELNNICNVSGASYALLMTSQWLGRSVLLTMILKDRNTIKN